MQHITNSNNFSNQLQKHKAQLPDASEPVHLITHSKKFKSAVAETSSQLLHHLLACLPETKSKPIGTISDNASVNASGNAFSNAALRSRIGGKGLFLTIMQEAGLPVPAIQCVETGIMESIERLPLPRKLLETHVSELARFTDDTFSLEVMKQFLLGMTRDARLRSLEQLSGFVASDAFYQQVVKQNREAVVKIRDAQQALIPGKPVIVRSSGKHAITMVWVIKKPSGNLCHARTTGKLSGTAS